MTGTHRVVPSVADSRHTDAWNPASTVRAEGTTPTRLPPAIEVTTRRRIGPRAWRWLAIAPAMILLTLFVVLPAAASVVLAFFDWNLLRGGPSFVGLENFRGIIDNGDLGSGLVHTLIYAALTVVPAVALGLIAALGINALARGRVLWRVIFFLPVASTLVAMAAVWRWIFLPRTGPWDRTIGAWTGTTNWLGDLDLALPAVAMVGIWERVGLVTVIYLAALSSVPLHLVDAARLDGAGPWDRFRHVTWPHLGPATALVLVTSTVSALRAFDHISVMTDGGPAGRTETLTFLLWQRGIYFQDIGGGAALTVVLLAVTLAVTVWQTRALGHRISSESTSR